MRSGFVALAGRPNAGKSTLINSLVGEKVAIVSDKPQTTRSEIRGIYTDEDVQIVFTDIPGIHKPKVRLETRMNREAFDVIQDVDLIYLVTDGSVPFGKGDQFVLDAVKNTGLPVFLILNKVDKMPQQKVMDHLLKQVFVQDVYHLWLQEFQLKHQLRELQWDLLLKVKNILF